MKNECMFISIFTVIVFKYLLVWWFIVGNWDDWNNHQSCIMEKYVLSCSMQIPYFELLSFCYNDCQWIQLQYVVSYESRGGTLPTSDFRLPTSDFRLPTSDFRLPTSDFRLRTSDFRLPTSDFRLPTSDFRLQKWNGWSPTCDLIPNKSGQILISA